VVLLSLGKKTRKRGGQFFTLLCLKEVEGKEKFLLLLYQQLKNLFGISSTAWVYYILTSAATERQETKLNQQHLRMFFGQAKLLVVTQTHNRRKKEKKQQMRNFVHLRKSL